MNGNESAYLPFNLKIFDMAVLSKALMFTGWVPDLLKRILLKYGIHCKYIKLLTYIPLKINLLETTIFFEFNHLENGSTAFESNPWY